ncbi:MAG: aminoacetone oxidase family FAD-binding enzyme [Lachnospiraceae bacterium]|nr:aminoacetone oxidase family FAD-binding enzyme [Lachnospiraceae bacterium]
MSDKNTRKKIIVAGGGAAGCMAAIAACASGADVTLIEKNKTVAKKILSTGNGKCNFCHDVIRPEDYHLKADDGFITSVLEAYPVEKCLEDFKKMGITPLIRDGYVYPYSEQAKSVTEVLTRSLKGVNVVTECSVTAIKKDGDKYIVKTTGKDFTSDAVIVTCGGEAAPVTGSSGEGYKFAGAFGLKRNKPVPALTSLTVKDHPYKKAAGVRIRGTVSVLIDGKEAGSDTGQIQITKTGFSGIPVFNVSRFASRALDEGKKVSVRIKFLPELFDEEIRSEFETRLSRAGQSAYDAMIGLFPDSFADALLRNAGIDPDKKTADAAKATDKLFKASRHMQAEVTGTGDMASSQVTCGGVMLSEIDASTMECIKHKGLYLAGEVLDIDGMCGGYNLYFAWASGYIAGTSAAR